MKLLILIIFLNLSFFAFGDVGQTLSGYTIVSDLKSDTVPENVVWVKGKVNSSTGTLVSGVFVSTVDQRARTLSNYSGEFRLQLLPYDSTLYAYHQNFGEVVCQSYDFKGGHVVTINFNLGEVNRVNEIQQEKPVVYMYSDKPISCKLTVKPTQEFTFTYPAIDQDNGWDILVEPDGGIRHKSKSYPYLFWESKKENLNILEKPDGIEGFLIQTDSATTFLEKSLTKLGFSNKEITDFVTYWAPRIMQYPFAQLQFLINEEYDEQIAEINCSERIENQLRVYLLFTGRNSFKSFKPIIEQSLETTFQRNGLTLVEWGGSDVTPNNLYESFIFQPDK